MKRNIIKEIIFLSIALFCFPVLLLLLIVEAGVNNLSFWILVLVIYVITLLVLILRFIQKRMLSPISILIKETKRISDGDLSQKIQYHYHDELGQLLSAFDHMRNELYQQQIKQEQFEINRKEFIDNTWLRTTGSRSAMRSETS